MRIGLLASVGHMVDSFFPGIISSWQAAGHTVSVAAGTPVDDGRCVVIDGLTRRPGPGTLRAGAGLRSWVDEQSLDVVVTNSATASGLVRMSRVHVPVVYFCHGLHWNSGRRLGERLWQGVEAALLSNTAGVITINADDHAWFAARVPHHRLLRLPTGVGLDLAEYPPSPMPSRGTQTQSVSVDPAAAAGTASSVRAHATEVLRLVWIGEFSPRKRPGLALEVARRLRALGIPFELRMLGQGSLLASTRARIGELGLESQIVAPGRGDAAAELAASHALVHTATWEGLPRVMLESLAVGRRTYAFDVKGVRDVPGAVLGTDGDIAGMADRIGADWASGALFEPVRFERGKLDFSHSADLIRRFLEDSVLEPRFVTARGHRARGHHPSANASGVQNGTP